jgi:hypothetical protein
MSPNNPGMVDYVCNPSYRAGIYKRTVVQAPSPPMVKKITKTKKGLGK